MFQWLFLKNNISLLSVCIPSRERFGLFSQPPPLAVLDKYGNPIRNSPHLSCDLENALWPNVLVVLFLIGLLVSMLSHGEFKWIHLEPGGPKNFYTNPKLQSQVEPSLF